MQFCWKTTNKNCVFVCAANLEKNTLFILCLTTYLLDKMRIRKKKICVLLPKMYLLCLYNHRFSL